MEELEQMTEEMLEDVCDRLCRFPGKVDNQVKLDEACAVWDGLEKLLCGFRTVIHNYSIRPQMGNSRKCSGGWYNFILG